MSNKLGGVPRTRGDFVRAGETRCACWVASTLSITCRLPSVPHRCCTLGQDSPCRAHTLFNARISNFVVSRSSRNSSCIKKETTKSNRLLCLPAAPTKEPEERDADIQFLVPSRSRAAKRQQQSRMQLYSFPTPVLAHLQAGNIRRLAVHSLVLSFFFELLFDLE